MVLDIPRGGLGFLPSTVFQLVFSTIQARIVSESLLFRCLSHFVAVEHDPLFSYKSGANLPEVRTGKCHPGFSMGPSLSKHSSWISQFQPLSLKNDEGQKKPQVIDARSVSWARAAGISWIHEVFSCWDILIVYSFWWKLPTLGSKKSPTGSIDPWFWFPQKARSQFTLHGVRW